MTDTPDSKLPPYVGNSAAPFIYFDFVPTYGILDGAIQLELAARTMLPGEGSNVPNEVVCTAHLRCSPTAAATLRDSLTKALEMLQQPSAPPAGTAMN